MEKFPWKRDAHVFIIKKIGHLDLSKRITFPITGDDGYQQFAGPPAARVYNGEKGLGHVRILS